MKIARKNLEGRPHLVVPTVMIREGTWAGSDGPVTYAAEVLRRSVNAWNGKPVVVYHPDMYGHSFAGTPEVFDGQKVGVIFNTRFEDGKLKADVWLDVARLEAVDPRVLQSLQRREVVEVSTGVCVSHNGTRNSAGAFVAEGLGPDHLAILPDQRGACSIADGAGLLRNSAVVETPLPVPAMF